MLQFQFHKGTIRTAAPIVGPAISAVFQFHKGTIRTMGCDNNLDILLFQFHKGTIRTCLLSVILLRWQYFNSIKVQLEHVGAK